VNFFFLNRKIGEESLQPPVLVTIRSIHRPRRPDDNGWRSRVHWHEWFHDHEFHRSLSNFGCGMGSDWQVGQNN